MRRNLKDIADRAGVSVSTVSRFVAGQGVRPAARAALEEAIGALGYQPNLAARRLRTRSSGTIGLLVPDLANPFFQRLAAAVEDRSWQAGKRVVLCNSDEDAVREARYLALLVEEQVDGIVVAPVAPTLDAMVPSDMPVVLIDRVRRSAKFDSVSLNNLAASVALVDALHEAGCRRIAGLFTRAPMVGSARRRGFMQAIAAHDIPLAILPVGHGTAAVATAVETAFARWPDLDAVVAGNGPIMFAAALAMMRRRHAAMLAGFDGADWVQLLDRPVVWIEQPVNDMAHAVLDLLARADRSVGPRRATFDGTIRSKN